MNPRDRERPGSWPHRLARAASERLVASTDRRALLLLLLVLAVDYAERTLIGALGPTLERTFHFGNTTLGLLAAVNGIVAALATLPLGWLTDRVSRTRLLGISLALFAGAAGLAGAAISLIMFFGARLLLGAVAATSGPTLPSLTGDLVRAKDRARALGLVESGQLVGSGLGFLLAALIASMLSWRWCFWLVALAALALALSLWRTREPERTGAAGPSRAAVGDDRTEDEDQDGERPKRPGDQGQQSGTRVQQIVREAGIAPDKRAILTKDPDRVSWWEAARYVVRVRTDLIVLVSRAIGDYFLAAVGTFGVVFATQQYHLSQSAADLAILALGIGALAGVLLVGRVGDALLTRRHISGRLWLGALGYLLAPAPLYFAFQTHALAVALPLFIVGAFCVAGAGPPLDAVRVDVVVPRLRGRAEAVRQVLRTAAEGGAPLVFGLLAARLAGGVAGLRLAYLLTMPALALSGLVLLLAVRTYAPDVAAALASTERTASRPSRQEADSTRKPESSAARKRK